MIIKIQGNYTAFKALCDKYNAVLIEKNERREEWNSNEANLIFRR